MGGVAEFVPAAHAEGCESGGVEGHGFLFSRKEEGGKRKEITLGGAGARGNGGARYDFISRREDTSRREE